MRFNDANEGLHRFLTRYIFNLERKWFYKHEKILGKKLYKVKKI